MSVISMGGRAFHSKTLYPNFNSISKLFTSGQRKAYRVAEMRDDFLSVASHELKTPLTSLKLQVQLISKISRSRQASQAAPDKLQALAENADRQITRMTSLINNLLEASRMRSGKLELKPENFDLVQAVREEVSVFSAVPNHEDIRVTVTADDAVPGCWDRNRVAQVVQSLLSNAATFGMGKPIEVYVYAFRGKARVSVRDYGMGISEKDRERIFDMFERGVPAANFGGLGLGLYISSQIAQAHEGSLDVESKLGEGSLFTLKLPLSESKKARAAGAA
jgi:signal transduction histidine kinase